MANSVGVRGTCAGRLPVKFGEDPMATDPNMEPSIWESLGDKLSALSDVVGRWLMRLFGSSNERYVRDLGYVRPVAKISDAKHGVKPGSMLDQVNSLEEKMRALTDDQLREMAPQFKQRLANGATLEDI